MTTDDTDTMAGAGYVSMEGDMDGDNGDDSLDDSFVGTVNDTLDSSEPAARETTHREPAGELSMDENAYALERYVRDIAGHELLDAPGEIELARRIEGLEVRVWEALLGYAPATEYVIELIAKLMSEEFRKERPDESREDRVEVTSLAEALQSLRSAAYRSRMARNRAARKLLADHVASAAAMLYRADRDRTCRDVIVSELENIAAGAPAIDRVVTGKLPFCRKGTAFAQYMARVRQAERAAARARHGFVEANLRLVLFIARQYARYGMPLSDLIQEGNMGLMKAVDRFDHRRGYRFSTYATWWIRHYVGRAVADKSRMVRVPVYLLETKQRVAREQSRLHKNLGRAPTEAEVAEATGFSKSRIRAARAHASGYELSLDAPVSEDGQPRIELFRSPEDEDRSPLDDATSLVAAREIRSLMHVLSSKQADVLCKRFGLDGDREWTLQEIADEYQVSRERIRQIQLDALSRLRRALEERALEKAAAAA